jgi:DNA-directed RNA polymerase specialized sigma24 family protein
MKGESARRVAAEKAASPAEIASAIEALTEADSVRLRQYAWKRIRGLGPKVKGQTGDDLLQTALADLLGDTRRWDKTKVGFMGFLFGAMKSIASNSAKSYVAQEDPVLESDLIKENEEGADFRPLHKYSSKQPSGEKQLSHKQTLRNVDNLFKEDQEAQMILTAWQEGYDPASVRELWDLSQNAYNTIVRRIRRTLESAGIEPDLRVGGQYVQ